MIVVDVGCHPQGPEESVHRLIDRFSPDLLLGFDPDPSLAEGVERVGGTVVVRRRAPAWVDASQVRVVLDGITTGVEPHFAGGPADDSVSMTAIDLPALLAALPDGEVVLKVDAEGVEYPLLRCLAASGLDRRLARVLVEWHPPETAHGLYDDRPELACPVEEW
jgi:hypothetical protein